MKMSSMKKVDKWLGLLLCSLMTPVERIWSRKKSGQVRKILVIKFWGIGSIVMTSYLLSAVREAAPGARIDLATIASNREAATMIGGADHLVLLDISKGVYGIFSGILNFLLRVYREKYDVVLDLEYLTRFTALTAFASRAPLRAGFYARGFWRGNFHDVKVPFNPYWHMRENFLNVGKAAGFDAPVPQCVKIEPGNDGRVEATKFLEKNGIEGEYAVINPNAGETSLERRWPTERYALLAKKIESELGMPVIVTGSAEEYRVVAEVVGGARGGSAINAAGKMTIRGLAAIFEKASVVVSNDSGPLHIASHVGAPVVGLYGPETPVLWGPLCWGKGRAEVLFADLDCSPCINVHNMKTVVCLRDGAECLLEITVEEVFEALRKLLREMEELRE